MNRYHRLGSIVAIGFVLWIGTEKVPISYDPTLKTKEPTYQGKVPETMAWEKKETYPNIDECVKAGREISWPTDEEMALYRPHLKSNTEFFHYDHPYKCEEE
jgi:hypothetical protein